MKKIVKKVIKQYKHCKYHRGRNHKFLEILKNIESEVGPLTLKLKKICDDYANDIFGSKVYAPCLYLYTATSGSFKEGWIPENYYAHTVAPKIAGHYGNLSNLKSLQCKLFGNSLFPDLAYFSNGLFFSKDYVLIDDKDVFNYIFSDNNKIVFKCDNSLQGRDIFIFNKSNFNTKYIKTVGNGVFQYFINQHSFFNRFNSTSVATIRLTTVVNDLGKVSVRGAYLRLAREKDTHVKSASNIRIPIDLISGKLYHKGYLANWTPIYKHPDSMTEFKGSEIPLFNKCKDIVIKMHQNFPVPRCIGWDIIINENDEIIFMEWNAGMNGIKEHEAYQGPCFMELGWEDLWKK